MNDLTIIPAEAHHVQEILSLLRMQTIFSRKELFVAEHFLYDALYQDNKKIFFYVALHDTQLVACAGFSEEDDTEGVYSLNWLAVHPDFIHQGIGKTLYLFLEQEIQKRKGRCIILNAGSGEPNQYFYQAMGFHQVGSFPEYFTKDKDLVWYYKKLHGVPS